VSAAGMTSGPYVCSGTQALGGAASTGETGGGSGNTTTPTTSADAPVTPINCSWSVAGLSLPGSGDYIADVQNGQSPYFYDGVTDAAGGCTGLANNYNSVIAMVDQDGGVEVFSLADASYQAGSGTVDFSSDPSFDFHTIRTASSDADPGSILGAGIQWFSNAADAEASYSEVTPGYAFVSTGSGESGTVSLGADPSAPAATSGATPVSCSWSVSGLTSPTSSDIIAENDNNSSATYADGVTDVVGSCVGVSGTYAQLVDMQNADGGVEVLTVADSWYVTVGNAGISFSNDPTWDLNTFNPTTSGSGHRLDLVSVAWYDNAAGAEAATGNVPGFVPGTSYVTSSPSGDQAVVSDGS
jgi:hypothetical protein